MADIKNARLDELAPLAEPPLDPPPPYEELESTGPSTTNGLHHEHPLIVDDSLGSSNIIQPPSPDPSLLSSKRAAARHLASSSSQSIAPAPRSPSDPRRTLLLVYIHGFYGNDQSFRAFPAHVHHHLSASPALSRSHVVHSKVYPRYKTYKAVDVARDNFSAWLAPHESPTTDVVLLGHSMGGLLAAEVVLKPSEILSPRPFKHRILGTVSLDAPFLGLHPGIVVSGISSLFRPGALTPNDHPDADASTSTSTSTPNADVEPEVVVAAGPADPNFDPPFFNDTPFRERPFLDRVVNFASKHSGEGLLHALGNHFTDHLAFGGCLADYRGLLSRYNRLRALEDVDVAPRNPSAARVRFVNYYTLCPGRPKPSKAPPGEEEEIPSPHQEDLPASHGDGTAETEAGTGQVETRPSSALSLQDLEPSPIKDEHPSAAPESTSHREEKQEHIPEPGNPADGASDAGSLPLPLPTPPPSKPEPPDFSQYTDKEARKQAEREFARLEKAYARDLRSHEKTLRERQKLADKQRRQLDKRAEKELKEQRKQADKGFKDERKQARQLEKHAAKEARERAQQARKHPHHGDKKLRKFCTTPRKVDGAADPAWVAVFMDGVDEVGAHCGLFAAGAHYDDFVRDVGDRIVGWVEHGGQGAQA
ncbi:hypothetical protein ESCO_000497 [Escovopsis weberi]|uniref:DUF676 domain-containing protein n=1 Tax=Escovopsis weberi TaxID=150374 RepID=A0A0M9VT67_ESCWE|nr:hypothetical protein ESCO_000497 [Escovopsis weberi]